MIRKAVMALILVSVMTSLVFAQLRSNVYQIQTWTPTTKNSNTTITFPYESRDVIVINGDATNALWVDLTGAGQTCKQNTAGCSFLPKGETLTVYDYATDAVALITYAAQASPVTVISVY